MRYLVGFLIPCVLGLGVLSFGCGKNCTAIGCYDEVQVRLVPELEVTYDVALVLDGEAGAFTCERSDDYPEWMDANPTGIARPIGTSGIVWCAGSSFLIAGAPEAVEITVTSEDGSWNGSLVTSPTYELRYPNGPDCPGVCRVAELTMTNDVGAFEVQP